jgi:hypothetical protein
MKFEKKILLLMYNFKNNNSNKFNLKHINIWKNLSSIFDIIINFILFLKKIK